MVKKKLIVYAFKFYEMRISVFLISIFMIVILGTSAVRIKPKQIEKLKWNIKCYSDTIELIYCDLCYFPDDSVIKYRQVYFYKNHLNSIGTARIDSANEPYIRYRNLRYNFRNIHKQQFLIISDEEFGKIYSYQVLSYSFDVPPFKIVLLKPEDERLLTDINYVHPGGVKAIESKRR